MGNQDQGSLVEAPLHCVIEFLSEDTGAIKRNCAAMGCVGRAQLDVRRIVGNGKIVAKILSSFGVLLLRKAACILEEARPRKADIRYLLKQMALKSDAEKGTWGG